MFIRCLILWFICLAICCLANEEDGQHPNEIVDPLPGINFELNFKHYSGYLQVSPTRFLYYWFVTSQGNPAKDPLIFWYNGGPGCSSLDGLLTEMGPFLVNPDGHSLRRNPFAWNKYASIVYIEAPAGVGYSYTTDGNFTTDDEQTALDNYEGLKQFFTLHPSFRHHSVFIMGESYAGIYVPTLTALVVKGQQMFPINLKGMMIGNGVMHRDLNIETSVKFAYGHGLIDEITWAYLEHKCCRGCVEKCKLNELTGSCNDIVSEIQYEMWHSGLNPYDLYRDCVPARGKDSMKMKVMMKGLLPESTLIRFAKKSMNISVSNVAGKPPKIRTIKDNHLPCLNGNKTDMATYMNLKETREILRIPSNVGHWWACKTEVSEKYKKIYFDMTPYMMKVVNAKVRILSYYGDTDMACNFLLGQQFSAQLGLQLETNKEPWYFVDQIAGFKTVYAEGLYTFMTVRGTGHMVPQWKAPHMDYVLNQFLRNKQI